MLNCKMLIVFLTLAALTAQAGRETGNGGDAIALEFKTTGLQIVSDLKTGKVGPFLEVNQLALEQAVNSTQLVSLEQVYVNGVEKDAANYPQKGIIEISRSRWINGSSRFDSKRALVFHEYLLISGHADLNYEISNRLLDSKGLAGSVDMRQFCDSLPYEFPALCEKTTSGHIFNAYAAELCTKNNWNPSYTMYCLKTIADRNYTPDRVDYCKARPRLQEVITCLDEK